MKKFWNVVSRKNQMRNFTYLQYREEAIPGAEKIARREKYRCGRTYEQHLEDSLGGLMVQYAARDVLREMGYSVTDAPPGIWIWDICVELNNIKYYIDVKAKFHTDKYFKLKQHYINKLSKIDYPVMYMMFNCSQKDNAVFVGVNSKVDFKSMYEDKWLINYGNNFKRTFPFPILQTFTI